MGSSLLRVRVLFCLLGIAESAFVPFLPLLLRDRGLSAEAIGAVLALFAAVGFASGPLWGYLADRRIGRERTLTLCLFGTVAGALLLARAHGAAALAVTGSVAWLFRSPNMALADALALDRLGVERRDAYGSVRLWMSAGFAAGAIVFGGLVEVVGIGLVAPLYACLVAANATAVAWVFRGRRLRVAAVAERRPAFGRGALTASVVLFLVALFLANSSYNATYNFVAVRIAALGGGAVFVGLAAGLQAAAEVPSMAATRRLARRLRPAQVFAAGAAVYVLVYAVWAVVANPAALAALRLVAGVGFGLTYVGAVLVADELVPERLRATGQAASKAVATGLAPVAGSIGGGLVYGGLGPAALFVLAAVFAAGSAVVAVAAEETQLEHPRRVEAVDA